MNILISPKSDISINEIVFIIYEIIKDHFNNNVTMDDNPIIETHIINFINNNLNINKFYFILSLTNRLEKLFLYKKLHDYFIKENTLTSRQTYRIKILARKIYKNISLTNKNKIEEKI